MQRKKKRAEQVSLLMQLDLDKLKEYELRNILRGMGIEVQGTKCAADLKKELVQNVPEMKSEMEARYS